MNWEPTASGRLFQPVLLGHLSFWISPPHIERTPRNPLQEKAKDLMFSLPRLGSPELSWFSLCVTGHRALIPKQVGSIPFPFQAEERSGSWIRGRCWHKSQAQNGNSARKGAGGTRQGKRTRKIRIYPRPLHRVLPGNAAGRGPALRGPAGLWLPGRLKTLRLLLQPQYGHGTTGASESWPQELLQPSPTLGGPSPTISQTGAEKKGCDGFFGGD